ncbi:RING finger protein 10, partial [Irineochytrium annulatum]
MSRKHINASSATEYPRNPSPGPSLSSLSSGSKRGGLSGGGGGGGPSGSGHGAGGAGNVAFSKHNNTSGMQHTHHALGGGVLGFPKKQSQRELKRARNAQAAAAARAAAGAVPEIGMFGGGGGGGMVDAGTTGSGGGGGRANKSGEVSLTHLLNFSFPPREPSSGVHASSSTSGAVSHRKRQSGAMSSVPFTRERFVNANYRFVMRADGDYTPNLFDPDLGVEWADIVQVIIPSVKPTSCPICLNPPVAPRVTRCGHVYCYPCILHYLSLSDNTKYSKCPICHDAVYGKDLKPARPVAVDEIRKPTTAQSDSSQKVPMTLMKRAIRSCVALPRDRFARWDPNPRTLSITAPPGVDQVALRPFAKLSSATRSYVRREVLEADRKALGRAVNECLHEELARRAMTGDQRGLMDTGLAGDGGERMWVESALDIVKKALDEMGPDDDGGAEGDDDDVEVVRGRRPSPPGAGVMMPGPGNAQDRGKEKERKVAWDAEDGRFESWGLDTEPTDAGILISPFDEDEEFEDGGQRPVAFSEETADVVESREMEMDVASSSVTAEPVAAASSSRVKKPIGPPSDGYYYFYQAADGRHLYLHPLDIKVLFHEFEGYDKFPDRMDMKMLIVQESTVNEDLRRRCKYLSHLPLSCDVNFCEVDLTKIVSAETLKVFERELAQRRQRHDIQRRKDKEEEDRARHLAHEAAAASAAAALAHLPPHLQHTTDVTRDQISSAWENPELFDSLFPSANANPDAAGTTPPRAGGAGWAVPGVTPDDTGTPSSSFAARAKTGTSPSGAWGKGRPAIVPGASATPSTS